MTKSKSLFRELSFKNIRYDLPAGLVVFLVALPLCLGISLASGAPLLSGIITGIIGGLVAAVISGSHTGVSGPAAGLTIVVLQAIHSLGSFEAFLLAVVLAGIFQFVLGFAKAGVISHYFPSSVIKGMLAAIGLILILKQLPHFLGYDADYEGDLGFIQWNSENSFSALIHAFKAIHPGAIATGILSLCIMVFWERLPVAALRNIPAPLVVVVSGILLNLGFGNLLPMFHLEPDMLVNIPKLDLSQPASFLIFPDFSMIGNPEIFVVAATLAVIASLETLLSIEAVDKLDPLKRHTDGNRELKAQGIGNILAGFIGGLPMTAVIVRSSANINSGARSKASAFIHGVFLLVSVLFLYKVINYIPLSALAAILLVIGYKLAKISVFKVAYKSGYEVFIPFVVTVGAILFTDLLVGICIGLAVASFFVLKKNARNSHSVISTSVSGMQIHIILSDEVSFLNKPKLKKTLEALPGNSHVVIDGSRSIYIDHDIVELISAFSRAAAEKNIKVETIEISEINSITQKKKKNHA